MSFFHIIVVTALAIIIYRDWPRQPKDPAKGRLVDRNGRRIP
jgi:hypothetical protein